MLKIVGRSRSIRGGGGGGVSSGHAGVSKAHGPYTPLVSEPGHVSGPTLQNSTVLGLVDNVDDPAVSFSDGRSPYLNRPLPPPPPPKTSVTMPGRPTTSGGLTTGKGMGSRNFDKRISRDDMFLKPASKAAFDNRRISRDDMFVGRKSSSRAAFHVPIRTQLPTPESSPRYEAPPMAAIPARMATPESLRSGEIQIGMALGSPSHPPSVASTAWQPQMPVVREAAPSSATKSEQPLQRSKTRRKIFGIFGSRKHAEPAKAQLESSDSESAATTPVRAVAQSPREGAPMRSNTQTQRPKHQPLMVRTNTEPFAKSPLREASTQPVLRSKASEPAFGHSHRSRAAMQDSLQVPAARSVSRPARSPYLDIEIPDVKMERYSVMFGSLLNQQKQQQPASSLLARRQATLDKLKNINDRIVQEEEARHPVRDTVREKRASSPQPTKSPGFTLFPPTPSTAKHVDSPPMPPPPMLSPRLRSNTSPALLQSPVKTTFEHAAQEPSPSLHPDRPKGSRLQVNPLRGNPTMRSEAVYETRELRKPKPVYFDPDQSSLILDSPDELSEDESRLTRPFNPEIPEPQWQMASPLTPAPPSSTSSSASSTRKRSRSSVSSVKTHVTKPSVEINEADSVLKNAVEVSIARQISISRQQRQMLRPLQSSTIQSSRRRANTTTTGPVRNQLGRNEKLQETKSSTPTLVVPPEAMERSQLMQHRKSERVVLEAA
ncbi:uncharacterized protein E0L32_008585 [Thyridium curvatum]|uniref:Uncharacterized protein n=1 Tax=Thyridium curvatum TaxID=1093900 RepID=A0A507AJM2_9PEZI|nr:uncharacterized protein E0L32_008585 [Thyridium curvatum]TPX10535.1 hypothetical protein E0L32_008585 [Thyridium curvatum]